MQARRFSQTDGAVRGFSLVEVLVSIVVLSIGLLGMVGMQASALQSNREARMQSVAYALVQELAEMMRGNKDVGILTTGNPYLGDFASSPLAPATVSYCLNASSSTGCTVSTQAGRVTLAQAQMTEWLSRVDQELSGARVRICADSAPYDSNGLPQWSCTAASGSNTAQMFIKIGWTQSATNKAAAAASAMVRVGDTDGRPALVFPVIAGSST